MPNESITYAITGATGHIGRRLTERLLAEGRTVRIFARNRQHMEPLVEKGASAVVGSIDDAKALSRLFDGAGAVFTLIPPNFGADNLRSYQNRVSEAFCEAIRACAVPRVVNVSSVGAHLPEGTGPVKGLYDNEQRMNSLEETRILHLRPTFFMENLCAQIDSIKKMGYMGSPVRRDLPMPMIATRDVAAFAALRLLKLDFSGKSAVELLGSGEVTMEAASRILGKAIGKPDLPYVEVPYEQMELALREHGMSSDMAALTIELYRGFNDGRFGPTVERSPENTTPTSLETFAVEEFAPLYRR